MPTRTDLIDELPEEVRELGRELSNVALAWKEVNETRDNLSKRRSALIVALDKAKVRHVDIGHLADSNKGAIEQVLERARRRGDA